MVADVLSRASRHIVTVQRPTSLPFAAQVDLVGVEHHLLSVQAPEWLHMNEQRTKVVAQPTFEKLD